MLDGTSVSPIAMCPDCEAGPVVEQVREQQFSYGPPGDQVTLTASMPVLSCEACGYEYFDERGEIARHAAICKHLGVGSPEEIQKIREITGLGRAAFCELGGFGSASLQRWESGIVIPNASCDRLIFLMQFQDNIERLNRRRENEGITQVRVATSEVQGGATLEVHTRRTVKRFVRLGYRTRITAQAGRFSLITR